MATIPGTYRHHDYTIAWISALPLEMAAAVAMLDERHPDLPTDLSDNNSYIFGSIYGHNIVIVCLPAGVYGTTSAAVIASQVQFTFKSIRFGLMVGIGGAVPSQDDIRLGDVVVSKPTRDYGGIVQYDYGKTLSNNRFERTGMLNKPPSVLLTAISRLQAEHMVRSSNIPAILSDMVCRYPKMKDRFTYRGAEQDVLFEADYDHEDVESTCANCNPSRRKSRPDRGYDVPVIHYGLIASANQVMKSGRIRDQLANEFGILCFEMEAAGLMDNFPCLVIRGICDYADSHKNKQWQEYAAATAAAYTKELLSMIHTKQVVDMPSPSVALELAQYGLKAPVGTETYAGEISKSLHIDIGQLLERISNYDHDKVHRRLAYKRLPGTTQWFLNHATFKSWLTGLDQSSLWCSGKIGSGKSIIAASVVEVVKYRALENSSYHCPTVFFYCENEHSGSLQAFYILASLIRQLAQLLYESHQSFPPDVARELERFFGRDRRVPDYDDLREIFNLLFSYMPNTIYVLDGLDALEQQECQKMLLLIRATFSSASPPNGSKIMLSSRNHVPGYVNIATFMPWFLRISTFNHVTQDIEFYIKASIDDKSMLRKLTSDCSLLEEVKRVLLAEASGMFLWVYLILEILWSTCFTDAEVHSALRRLPKGLKETYRLCTQRISSDPRAAKVLKWVSFATRPLHIEELKEAVAFDLHDTCWDHAKVPQDEFVLGCCANLVVLDPTDGCVRFAHSSVKKFLLSDRAGHDARYLESEARGNLESRTGSQFSRLGSSLASFACR
ncbi:purine and uridine phosphorylase [Aspergillus violaceofuscus CBS 115571]|uniref:Purine and uridine phosphorylase n=1 Tax=Aspergillus violaceofuscus (strain CBS 115571) TaxID=1450538 RepID=A0A2V5HGK4_ASPV1|nr:purine and uridine phosphorylase [Aspergillus violaceofuscus CBS 115571]